MTEMVERVARAIYMAHWDAGPESKRGQDHRFPPMWDAASSPVKDWCRVQARAAIAEMREPTGKMIIATYGGGSWTTSGDRWRAMIDAALEVKERE